MKVLIVDDHTLVRRGLAHVVKECFPDAEVAEAGSADEAEAILEETSIDVVLTDVRMPDRDGLELLREVKARWPEVPVIILTSFDHSRYVRQALADGANGYMLKDAKPEDLHQAITVALSGGGNVLSAAAIRSLFGDSEGPDQESENRPETNLTQREMDILTLLVEGHSNRVISQALYLSEKTVKAHMASVFRKLGVTNRTQAAMAAVSMGMGPGRHPNGDGGSSNHHTGRYERAG